MKAEALHCNYYTGEEGGKKMWFSIEECTRPIVIGFNSFARNDQVQRNGVMKNKLVLCLNIRKECWSIPWRYNSGSDVVYVSIL